MWQIINNVANILGILGALFALFAWINTRKIKQLQANEAIRLNGDIRVELRFGGKKLELPLAIRRKIFSRAEVLGRIGMIPMKKDGHPKFSLDYLNTPEFLQQLNQVMDGNGDGILTIPCSEDEFTQFKLS